MVSTNFTYDINVESKKALSSEYRGKRVVSMVCIALTWPYVASYQMYKPSVLMPRCNCEYHTTNTVSPVVCNGDPGRDRENIAERYHCLFSCWSEAYQHSKWYRCHWTKQTSFGYIESCVKTTTLTRKTNNELLVWWKIYSTPLNSTDHT